MFKAEGTQVGILSSLFLAKKLFHQLIQSNKLTFASF